MNKRQQEVYKALSKTPPKSHRHGWDAAYWCGFDHPGYPRIVLVS